MSNPSNGIQKSTEVTETEATEKEPAPTFPSAVVVPAPTLQSWFGSRLWIATLFCAALSLGLFWYSRQQTGDLIEVTFRDGYGLKPEDRLRYSGIDVGVVEKVGLNKNLDGVVVHARLTPQSRIMASEGAKFWIVRPRLSLDAIHGLDTILGAKYIAIEPGSGSEFKSHFQGLDTPPIPTPPAGSLEITLDANTKGGLESGAPILYRGFRIGSVMQIGLASDARTVRARCIIDSEYRDLVRSNSKFWNRSGWRLDIGIGGIQLDADTIAQMLTGGVEMATPTESSPSVNTGHRFVLYDKAEKEWLEWKPSLAHGLAWSRMETQMPQPIRMALRWQERSFGFRKNHQRLGWCLPLSDGSIMCLSEQIHAPNSAITNSISIELAGISLRPDQFTTSTNSDSTSNAKENQVSTFSPKTGLANDVVRWQANAIASKLPEPIANVVLGTTDGANVIAIDAARMKPSTLGWEIDASIAIDQDLNGHPVLSAETNQVIGLLKIEGKTRCIVGLGNQ